MAMSAGLLIFEIWQFDRYLKRRRPGIALCVWITRPNPDRMHSICQPESLFRKSLDRPSRHSVMGTGAVLPASTSPCGIPAAVAIGDVIKTAVKVTMPPGRGWRVRGEGVRISPAKLLCGRASTSGPRSRQSNVRQVSPAIGRIKPTKTPAPADSRSPTGAACIRFASRISMPGQNHRAGFAQVTGKCQNIPGRYFDDRIVFSAIGKGKI